MSTPSSQPGSFAVSQAETYQPPQGPPPSRVSHADQQPPPPSYEDWMAVTENPSSAGLPPPPTIHYEDSPNHNASELEERQADAWCRQYPLFQPARFDNDVCLNIFYGKSSIVPLDPSMARQGLRVERTGATQIMKTKSPMYQCLRSQSPLYSALHSPSRGARSFTAYFEVRLVKVDRKSDVVAIGFFAPPYPAFRLPGWQRASIGIHGDDGRRYVNDTCGGMDFTKPFRTGEIIGLGMTFEQKQSKSQGLPFMMKSEMHITN
ncbi:MAG: hypothetical protein Q9159_003373 [Coniocarpon cinnabarinum]